MMQLLTTAAHDVPPPGATPARADSAALFLARSGCGPVGVLPFGLGAPLPPGASGDGGNAAQILNIHSLIDAAVAIRTPRAFRPRPHRIARATVASLLFAPRASRSGAEAAQAHLTTHHAPHAACTPHRAANPMYDSEATLAAVAAYAGTGIWRPPPVVSHAGNGSADTFPAQSSAADLNGTAAHGGGGAGGGAVCGGGRRGAAGVSSASAVGCTRPRRQLLSREDPAGLEERTGEHGNAPEGGRRRRKGGKGGRAEPEQPEATGRQPGGISEKRGVLRPWPDDGNARGQLRVIRRKEGQVLLSRHPGKHAYSKSARQPAPPLRGALPAPAWHILAR